MNLSVAVICGSSFGMNDQEPTRTASGVRRPMAPSSRSGPRLARGTGQTGAGRGQSVASARAPLMASCSSGLSCWSEVHPLTFLA